MRLPLRAPHTDALLARLVVTGIAVGDGEPPDGAGWQDAAGTSAFVPYMTLYSIDGAGDGSFDGTMAEPDVDADWAWQVTAVGATRDQCEQVADKARVVLLNTPLAVTGRNVLRLRIDMPSGARPDRTEKPHLWISTERYRLVTTPP